MARMTSLSDGRYRDTATKRVNSTSTKSYVSNIISTFDEFYATLIFLPGTISDIYVNKTYDGSHCARKLDIYVLFILTDVCFCFGGRYDYVCMHKKVVPTFFAQNIFLL